MHELVYTSAPKGLKPGSQGFCTVACSAGMPPNLMMRLEALSAYRPLQLKEHEQEINPVVFSHLILRVAGTDWHVLSRIADAGVDYTKRANKIAHHIVFELSELPSCGPAALLACENRFFKKWDSEPKVMTKPVPFPMIKSQPKPCRCWERETGDAGWGGVLAATARDNQAVNLVARPETDVLAMFEESLALLPPDIRWQTTLTTYYTRFPSGVNCRWRRIMAGSPEMSQIGTSPDAMVIDLTQPLKTPVPNPLVKAARSGRAPTVFLNVGNIAGLSATIDAERQRELPPPTSADRSSETTTANQTDDNADGEIAETVPVGKGRKPKSKTKRNRKSSDDFLNAREQWLESTKQSDKGGLLALIGLGFAFFGVPILLLALMLSSRGCNDSANGNSTSRALPTQRAVVPEPLKQNTRHNNTQHGNSPNDDPDEKPPIADHAADSTNQQSTEQLPSDVADHAEDNLDKHEDDTSDGDDNPDTNITNIEPVQQGRKLHIVIQRADEQSLIEAKIVSGTNAGGFDLIVPEPLFDLNDVEADQLLMTLVMPPDLQEQSDFVARTENGDYPPQASKHVEVYSQKLIAQTGGQSPCLVAFDLVPDKQGVVVVNFEYQLYDETIDSLNQALLGIKKIQHRLPLNEIELPHANNIDEAAKLAWLDKLVDDTTKLDNVAGMANDAAIEATTRRQIERFVTLLRCHDKYLSGRSKDEESSELICVSFDYDIFEKHTGSTTEIVHVVTSRAVVEPE